MLNSLPVALLVGTLLGFLSGLGVGGGSLLILWLTLVLNLEPSAARSVNLLFFLPSAAISCFYRRKQGILQMQTVIPGILGGCSGAVLGSWIASQTDALLLRKLLGVLLLITGIRELMYRPKKTPSH